MAGLPFAVVGGVAAIAHGAATSTKDLDIAMPMTRDNLEQLLSCMAPFRPRHAMRHDLGLLDGRAEELARFRLLLIDSDLGRLDVLRNIEPIGGYEALETVEMELLEGRVFKVISLDQLITVKAHLGRRKDLIVAQELRAIRDLRRCVK